MSAQYLPKTLAKTITYIVYRSPGEFGLFWNPDGTIPWKEVYWALQEDPALRFVRESHIRELAFLGLELPFALEGNVLRLLEGHTLPDYPVAETPPERLYFGCRRKNYGFVLEHGLLPSNRPFLSLASAKDLAMRIARRREPDPIPVEVLAKEAFRGGLLFREAGPQLYLAESVPLEYLLCPPTREKDLQRFASRKKKGEAEPRRIGIPSTPGSFFLGAEAFQGGQTEKQTAPGAKKSRSKGADWKRESRKERGKRDL